MQHPLYRVLTELQLTRFVYSIDINNKPCWIRRGCIFYVNYYLGQNSLICSCQRIGRYILHKAFVCTWAKWPIQPELISDSLALSDQKYFYSPSPWQGYLHSFIGLPWCFSAFHLYCQGERSTVKVKCFTQEHNTLTQPGVKSASLNQKSSALIFRPPLLPLKHQRMMILLTMFVVKAM